MDLWGCPLKREVATLKEHMKHADWRLRPMTPTMLRYATLDVHYLVSLYKLQVRELLLSSLATNTKQKSGAEKMKDENDMKANRKKAYILERKNKDLDASRSVREEGGRGGETPNVLEDDGNEYDSDGEILKDGKVVITEDNLAVHQNRRKSGNIGESVESNGKDEDEDEEGLEVWGMDTAPPTPAPNGKVRPENVLSDRFDDEGEDDDDEIDGEGEGGGQEVSVSV